MDGFARAGNPGVWQGNSSPVRWRWVGVAAIAWAAAACCCKHAAAQGAIQTILDSVRGDSAGDSGGGEGEFPPPSPSHSRRREPAGEPSCDPENSDGYFGGFLLLSGACITSPIWAPIGALDDTYTQTFFFPRFPYDDTPGHLFPCPESNSGRPWSGRLNVDYLEPFGDVSGINGRLLLSTSSRFGLDTEASHFEERRSHGAFDSLWIGDANLVFRFAQSEKAEFRTGLGFNWLHYPGEDAAMSDFGFNFTYGADFFPRKPWVLSADLDAGNLGRAGLFRFRATGRVMLRSVEVYTGYEYLDIGRTHFNMLLAGVRVWF